MRKMTMLMGLFAMMLVSASALAEQPKAGEPKKEQGYSYEFKDDALLGAGLDGQSGVIKVRQTGMRDRLIRPRVQFINEMLKSVEAI